MHFIRQTTLTSANRQKDHTEKVLQEHVAVVQTGCYSMHQDALTTQSG